MAAKMTLKEASDLARSVSYDLERLTDYADSIQPKVTVQELVDTGPSELAREWLDRERLLGLITPEGARAVEKLIEDLR